MLIEKLSGAIDEIFIVTQVSRKFRREIGINCIFRRLRIFEGVFNYVKEKHEYILFKAIEVTSIRISY